MDMPYHAVLAADVKNLRKELRALNEWADQVPHEEECSSYIEHQTYPCNCVLSRRPKGI